MTTSTSTATTPNAQLEHLLIVEVRGQLFGLDASHLREVVPLRRPTRIPGAPAVVRGLINLRGSLVVVADLAVRLFGGVPREEPEASIVLIEDSARTVGLVVSDVRDVLRLETELLEGPLPEGPAGGAPPASLCRSVGRLEGEIVIVLDVAALVRQVVA